MQRQTKHKAKIHTPKVKSIQLSKCLIKNKPHHIQHKHQMKTFSTTTTSSTQPLYQFTHYETAQAGMLQHFPENQQFTRDMQYQNFNSATQSLNRMELIFQSMPMPSLQIEVGLRSLQLNNNKGMNHNSIQTNEKMLEILNTTLPYNTTNHNISHSDARNLANIPYIFTPILSTTPSTHIQSTTSHTNSIHTSSNTNLQQTIPIMYNNNPLESTYIPLLSNIIINYIATYQYDKITPLITKYKTIMNDNNIISTDFNIIFESLQGYALEHQFSSLLTINQEQLLQQKLFNEKKNNGDENDHDDNNDKKGQEQPQKKKFVLKTTKTDTNSIPTTTPKPLSTTTTTTTTDPHHNDSNTQQPQTVEDILKQKDACQKRQLKAQEENDLQQQNGNKHIQQDDNNNNEKKLNRNSKYPNVNNEFINLLTTLQQIDNINNDTITTTFLSTELLNEIDSLPITLKLNNNNNNQQQQITPKQLFSQIFTHYIKSLHTSLHLSETDNLSENTNTTINNNPKLINTRNIHHVLDSLTHLSSLLQLLIPIQHQLRLPTSTLQQYMSIFNTIQCTLLYEYIDGYQTLSNPTNIIPQVPLLQPYHITLHGPRLLTSELAIQSNNLTHLNATLKSAEKFLSFHDTNILTQSITNNNDNDSIDTNIKEDITKLTKIFTNFDKNKGSLLSPLLLSIGYEYLSLNPINTEGLARTAINYLEKQNHQNVYMKQLLIDSYLSYAYILSNLSWNGKQRTAEAINIVLKAKKIWNEHNKNDNDDPFVQQIISQNDTIVNTINNHLMINTTNNENNNVNNNNTNTNQDRIVPIFPRHFAFTLAHKFNLEQNGANINWDDVAKHGQDYNITFTPLQQGIDQWIYDKYTM